MVALCQMRRDFGKRVGPQIQELGQALRQEDPGRTMVKITAFGSIEVGVKAMKHRAYDIINKFFDSGALVHTITRGLERNPLLRGNRLLRQHLGESATLQGLVGQSPPMCRLYERLQAVARTNYTVLIRGRAAPAKSWWPGPSTT